MSDVKLFGRNTPEGDPATWQHVLTYPIDRLGIVELAVAEVVWPSLTSRGTWPLELIRWFYDQGKRNNGEGMQSCVGESFSELMTIKCWLYLESVAVKYRRPKPRSLYTTPLFYSPWLYHKSQDKDGDPRTTPEADNGAFIWAAAQVMKEMGHVPVKYNRPPIPEDQMTPELQFRIGNYYWSNTLGGIKIGLALGPGVGGWPWLDAFMWPRAREVKINGVARTEYWIGEQDNWGGIMGGHAVCICGVSDSREGILIVGSWGLGFPMVWVSYKAVERLLQMQSEFCFIVNREPVR